MPHRKLKGLRAEYNITQVEMAEIIGISEQSYVSKENGQVDFRLTEIKKILEHFNDKLNANCTFEEIFCN